MKNSLKSYVLNFLVIIGLTVIALWFALKDNYQEVLTLISGLKWYWLIIIVSLGILYSLFVLMSMYILARKYKKGFITVHCFHN